MKNIIYSFNLQFIFILAPDDFYQLYLIFYRLFLIFPLDLNVVYLLISDKPSKLS